MKAQVWGWCAVVGGYNLRASGHGAILDNAPQSALTAILRDIRGVAVIQSRVEKVRCIAMYDIPETGFLRLSQVLSVIPIGKTSWWNGVKSGRFPRPIKLSPRCTAWRAEDIRDLIMRLAQQS